MAITKGESAMRICICGAFASYIHKIDCPYPEFNSDNRSVAKWNQQSNKIITSMARDIVDLSERCMNIGPTVEVHIIGEHKYTLIYDDNHLSSIHFSSDNTTLNIKNVMNIDWEEPKPV